METVSLLAEIRHTVQFYRRLKLAEKTQPACVDCAAYFLRSGATVSQASLDAFHAAKHEEPPASHEG